MKDLYEDKNYLKKNLWPAFEGIYLHQDETKTKSLETQMNSN